MRLIGGKRQGGGREEGREEGRRGKVLIGRLLAAARHCGGWWNDSFQWQRWLLLTEGGEGGGGKGGSRRGECQCGCAGTSQSLLRLVQWATERRADS